MARRMGPIKTAKQAQWYRAQAYAARLADDAEGAEDDEARAGRLEAALDTAQACRRCGRALSDPVSVARAVGPECIKKVGPGTSPEREVDEDQVDELEAAAGG